MSNFFIKICLLFMIMSMTALSHAETNTYFDDSVITAKIKAKIALDKSISIFNVGVNTNKGIVSLVGTVDSDIQAQALIELSQETNGAMDVNTDHLHIKNSARPIVDMLLASKIKQLLLQKKVSGQNEISIKNVKIEVKDSVVYLMGTVNNQNEIDNAIKIAKSVPGIKEVESRLELK